MESYFSLNDKLKSIQQKVISAAKYIPTDIMKQIPLS